MPVNFIVCPEWLVPVIPQDQVLTQHAVVVEGSVIAGVYPRDEAIQKHPDYSLLELPGKLVTAGLVNAHGHAAMALLRGYADDRALMDWLNNHIWPAESQLMCPEFVRDGTTLAVAEMISTGTTCAADSYFFPNEIALAFEENGFRGQVCMPVIQFPTAWASTESEHIEKAADLGRQYANHPLIQTAFAPHAPYTVTDEAFTRIGELSKELGMPIHLHLHETATEVIEATTQAGGGRPFKRIQALGLLDSTLQTVHMTQLIDEEIEALSEAGAHVAHCPESNMKLASGICPTYALGRAGVNVAVGTDGAASNNNLDMLEEVRTAALLAKVSSLDATAIDAHEALRMATINGARLLGLEHRIGSLEAGKAADMIAVDLSGLHLQPIHHPVSQLIYAASGNQVSHTWINGVCLYEDHQFTRMDVARIEAATRQWRDKVAAIS